MRCTAGQSKAAVSLLIGNVVGLGHGHKVRQNLKLLFPGILPFPMPCDRRAYANDTLPHLCRELLAPDLIEEKGLILRR